MEKANPRKSRMEVALMEDKVEASSPLSGALNDMAEKVDNLDAAISEMRARLRNVLSEADCSADGKHEERVSRGSSTAVRTVEHLATRVENLTDILLALTASVEA